MGKPICGLPRWVPYNSPIKNKKCHKHVTNAPKGTWSSIRHIWGKVSCYIARKPRNEVRSQCQGQSDSKWYAPLQPSQEESPPQIWDSYIKYIEDMLWTNNSWKLGQRSRSQWPKNGLWHSGIPRCIYIPNLEFLFKEYRRYAPVSRN